MVCHTCDVRSCVNPSHLWLGTARDNVQDMHKKGRYHHAACKGELNHLSKLTDQQARRIKYGTQTAAQAAAEFGVSTATVYMMRKGLSWKHI